MPRASIDYLNARRAAKAAAGGTTYDRDCRQAPDRELSAWDAGIAQCRSAFSDFALWAEASRHALVNKLAIPQQGEQFDDIPF